MATTGCRWGLVLSMYHLADFCNIGRKEAEARLKVWRSSANRDSEETTLYIFLNDNESVLKVTARGTWVRRIGEGENENGTNRL